MVANQQERTILIVDDDPQILEVVGLMLASLAYRVILARNGDAALEVLQGERVVDLLFTDVVMPGSVDGFELARIARDLRPDIRVVYTTGFSNRPLLNRGTPDYAPFLAKPWRADQLASLVARTLQ